MSNYLINPVLFMYSDYSKAVSLFDDFKRMLTGALAYKVLENTEFETTLEFEFTMGHRDCVVWHQQCSHVNFLTLLKKAAPNVLCEH